MEFTTLEFVCKDEGSGGGGSPALYKVDGGYVVQAKIVGPRTHDAVRALGASTLTEDEVLGFVPDNVVAQLRALPA